MHCCWIAATVTTDAATEDATDTDALPMLLPQSVAAFIAASAIWRFAVVNETSQRANDVRLFSHHEAQIATTSSLCSNTICIESTAQKEEEIQEG
jgi:hypothetical protein